MSGYDNFVTESSIKAKKDDRKQARALILEKAKRKYEADERREKKKKESGEGTWMLDTVSKRICKEQKNLEDAVLKEKKKKKKSKKKKKKKNRKRSDSSSSSSKNSEKESMWVESKAVTASSITSSSSNKPLQRDSWMEAPIDLLPAISRQEIRDEANKAKEKARMEKEKHLQPGQHARELNPYWKDGGSGLPDAPKSSTSITSGAMGDGGLSWMLKALSRMKEQAKEEGRDLEAIAAERYGSLERLMSMIRKAEKSCGRGKDKRDLEWRDRGSDRYREYRVREMDGQKDRNRYTDGDRKMDKDRERNTVMERESERHRERSKNDQRYADSRDKHNMESKSGYKRGLVFQRPGSSDDEGSENRSNSSSKFEHGRKRFRKPGDDDQKDKRGIYDKPSEKSRPKQEFRDERNRSDGRGGREGWKKSNSDGVPRWKKRDADESNSQGKKETLKQARKISRSSSSASSSSSSSDDEPRKREVSESDEEVSTPAAPKVMTEAELNELAAKVLRAEIMGDENLATELKSTLEAARQLRESSKTTDGKDFVHSKKMEKGERKDTEKDKEDNIVVLSRTNKAGMARPVMPTSSEEWSRSGSKKKKKKNVTTHSDSGERTKYFHDDDNFDLKTLVEREKAGTAEDQNSMFARLAGRETDRDMDMDDMFVSKAAKNHQEEEAANRDKMAAIMEHRKRSSAMEKCNRCFDKVPKHLIVAIGRKSYLCLPEHASLTEGHCFIVPMAHSSSATTLDEDVWQDIQHFRKSLVQMFVAQDKDVVVMETVMHLKHFPHMAIECVPLEREVGDLAPIYFKKAMQEVGPEWAQNKKVHDLSKKDVRHTVPKGFPYFSVDFGLQGGFVHVIEEEATFPSYFGREIVGGMLDVEPGLWRKPRKQNFEDQRQKMLQFEQWWSSFDWTQDIG